MKKALLASPVLWASKPNVLWAVGIYCSTAVCLLLLLPAVPEVGQNAVTYLKGYGDKGQLCFQNTYRIFKLFWIINENGIWSSESSWKPLEFFIAKLFLEIVSKF